jgi:lipopolysaccharide export system protein LptA
MNRLALLVTLALVVRLGFPVPLLADAAGQDKPVDVSGNWALTVETSGGTGTPSVEFKQDGETLTGNYSSQVFGEQKVTGTIKGNAITFGFTTSFQGSTVTVTYTGTADATTMKGKVTVGELGEGTFTGKKK